MLHCSCRDPLIQLTTCPIDRLSPVFTPMQHITGSSFFVDTETSDTEASSSTAEGVGLSGGVAGEPLSFVVQTVDERQREVQALVGWAEVRNIASVP